MTGRPSAAAAGVLVALGLIVAGQSFAADVSSGRPNAADPRLQPSGEGFALRSRPLSRFRRLRAANARKARTPQGVPGPAARRSGAHGGDALRARARRGLPAGGERAPEARRSPPARAGRHAARDARPGRCVRGTLLRGPRDAAAGTRHARRRSARCDARGLARRDALRPRDAEARRRRGLRRRLLPRWASCPACGP